MQPIGSFNSSFICDGSVARTNITLPRSSSFARAQLSVEELGSCLIRLYPRPPQQEVVDLVGENDLLDPHILPAQALNQVRGLGKRNVAVIVAMDEEHW